MLAVAYTAVAHDLKRDHTGLVFGRDELDDLKLLQLAGHATVVVAGFENKFGKDSLADGFVVDGEVHGDVTEVKSHDGGVGDDDPANHVGAIGKDIFGTEKDLDVLDAKTRELVETCDG